MSKIGISVQFVCLFTRVWGAGGCRVTEVDSEIWSFDLNFHLPYLGQFLTWYNTTLRACIPWLFHLFVSVARHLFKVSALNKMSVMIFLICSFINMFVQCQQIKKGEFFFFRQSFLLRLVVSWSPRSFFSLIYKPEVFGLSLIVSWFKHRHL